MNSMLGKCLRLRDVKRFHTVNSVRQQTVAEHSFLVAVIALDLFNSIVGVDPDNRDGSAAAAYEILAAALYHDHEESVTGDIPSPAKESSPTADHGLPLLYRLPGRAQLSHSYHDFVVLADKLEAAVWAEENLVGNHRGEVCANCWSRFSGALGALHSEQPEAGWLEAADRVLLAMGTARPLL